MRAFAWHYSTEVPTHVVDAHPHIMLPIVLAAEYRGSWSAWWREGLTEFRMDRCDLPCRYIVILTRANAGSLGIGGNRWQNRERVSQASSLSVAHEPVRVITRWAGDGGDLDRMV